MPLLALIGLVLLILGLTVAPSIVLVIVGALLLIAGFFPVGRL